VDVEDWFQSVISNDAPISERFAANTDRVLELLDRHGVRGTFFVLGLAAEKAPQVVRAIQRAGHEVQSHGYGHRRNYDLTRDELRDDLSHAKKLLEDITGEEVFAYRAPQFTITEANLWALDVLVETGHRYDSSIFPMRIRHYGIDGFDPSPSIVATPGGARIVEAPVAVVSILSRRVPVGGGGYVRLWPWWLIRRAWSRIERQGRPGILYMHPYEMNPRETDEYRHLVGLRKRLHQSIGRKSFPRKLDRLLRHFRFAPLGELLAELLARL
jgi:polysaccharide deacetylase family protein (PEP-CTERM system associated)